MIGFSSSGEGFEGAEPAKRRYQKSRMFLFVWLAISIVALPVTRAWSQEVVTRGPYLQSGTENSIVVRWWTDLPTDSEVRFGPAPGSLTDFAADLTLTVAHEITLTSLDPDTKYFYAVGTTLDILAGDDTGHFFVTSPAAGTAKRTRVWVIGDSGTAHQQQLDPAAGEVRDPQGVRDSFLAYSGTGVGFVSAGEDWKYLDDGSDRGTAWRDPAFDDTAWASGPSELGYGDGDEATVINCGPSAPLCNTGDNIITTYFRRSFDVADASLITDLTLTLLRDDGAVVYLNGTEVFRSNMPAGAIDFTTLASSGVGSAAEHVFHKTGVDPALLVDGTNVLAVEAHQISPASSDISFNLELFGRADGGTAADLWLTLGDNAYTFGTDDEWQQALFNPYPVLLRNIPLWPSLGNHDVLTADGGPYHDIMTLPTNAEAGGVASGTEQYYSFDYGNIHFVAVDSTHQAGRQPGSAMLTWLANDLAATTQDWIIAYWHHAPYTKGSHDSDAEGDLIEMRENVLQILEAGGVDLVLAGHSHNYERSMLIDGFYATPTTILDGTVVDSGDGCVVTGCDGPYNKPTTGPAPNEGTVYAVVGNSGRNNSGVASLDHPVMSFSADGLGSMILDIDGDRLDATLIDRDCATENDPGCVVDRFTIVKGAIQPIYLGFSSDTDTLAASGAMPFAIKFENITDQAQPFMFALFVHLPTGQLIDLLADSLGLGPLSFGAADFALPIPADAPLGTWTLISAVGVPGVGVVDRKTIKFTVE